MKRAVNGGGRVERRETELEIGGGGGEEEEGGGWGGGDGITSRYFCINQLFWGSRMFCGKGWSTTYRGGRGGG